MLFASKTELAVFCLLASLSANGFMQMLVSVWVVVSRVDCAEDKVNMIIVDDGGR